jgi:hypothetical protein
MHRIGFLQPAFSPKIRRDHAHTCVALCRIAHEIVRCRTLLPAFARTFSCAPDPHHPQLPVQE